MCRGLENIEDNSISHGEVDRSRIKKGGIAHMYTNIKTGRVLRCYD